ncbi:MAG: polyprenyl synthetase family protein [Desulfitobacteriaceae bacterium]
MLETFTPTSVSPELTYSPVLIKDFKESPEWETFETELEETLAKLQELIGPSVNLLRESAGKRIRPLLVFASCALFQPPQRDTIKAAVAAELIHLASLIHDDIIDRSSLRRGKPSVNALHGNQAAVLLGDALFAESFRILASPGLLPTMRHFIRAIQAMCTGEIQQGYSQYDTKRSLDEYLRHIAQKTGALIEASSQAGAETAHATKSNIEQLRAFGSSLGIAFQITDDILDFVGQEDHLGKPVQHDLRQGNFTLPVIYLLNDPLYRDWYKDILKRPWQPTTAHQVLQAVRQSGALAKSKTAAVAYVEKAKTILHAFPDSPTREFLFQMSDSVLIRLH